MLSTGPAVKRMNYEQVKLKLERGIAGPAPPTWTENGPLSAVSGLGKYFARRLASPNLPEGGGARTPLELSRRVNGWLRGMGAGQRAAGLKRVLSSLCQNRRASTCAGDYMVRDVNPGCLMGLAALLSVLWGSRPAPPGGLALRPAVADAVGQSVQWRTDRTAEKFYPAAQCPCRSTQRDCEAHNTGGTCLWTAGGVCVPRAGRVHGFEGVGALAGQRVPPVAPLRRGSRYARNVAAGVDWRRPARLPLVPVWDGSRFPHM